MAKRRAPTAQKKSGTKRKPRAIDLFCGCGGLTHGLKRAGFRVIGALDNDSLSLQGFRKNHPEVHVWQSDITDLAAAKVGKRLRLRKGSLELLAGCPPCQGFSTMRTKNGKRVPRDPQNDLLFEFQRFIEVLRPKAVIMENVPNMARSYRFKQFRRRLEVLGYVGQWRILNAKDYGVPQRRRRLIYMAGHKSAIEFGKPSPESVTVRQAIGGLGVAGRSGDQLHDLPEKRSPKVSALIKRIPKNGGSRSALSDTNQLKCHKKKGVGFKDVYGRMAWDQPAPTITGGCFNPSKGRFLHPTQNRAITMREASLLQGFPRHYKFPIVGHKQAIALMIGNAFPPKFVECHAREVTRWLRNRKN